MVGYIRRIDAYGRDIKLYLVYNLLVYIGFGVLGLVYNLYLYELDLREDFIGAFSAVQTLTIAGASLTMGRPLNRFGAWRCIFVSSICFLAVSLGMAFIEWPPVLLVLAVLLGLTVAYISTTTMPFIIEWGRRDQRAEIATIVFSLISLATTFGSLVGGFAPGLLARAVDTIEPESVDAYRWTLVLGTLATAVAIMPLLRMGEARQVPRGADQSAARAAEPPHVRRQARMDITIFVLVGGVMSIGMGMVFPFYNVYLSTLGASAGEIGVVFAIGGLFAAVIGLGAPALGRRVGSLWAVLIVRNTIVPIFLLLIVAPSYALAVIAHWVRATSVSMAWPLDSTFISEVLPPRARSSVFGLRSGIWNIGWSAASLLGGWVIVETGYNWPFACLAVFTFLSTVLYVGYYSRHPMVRAGEIPSALSPRQRAAVAQATAAAAGAAAEPSPSAHAEADVVVAAAGAGPTDGEPSGRQA